MSRIISDGAIQAARDRIPLPNQHGSIHTMLAAYKDMDREIAKDQDATTWRIAGETVQPLMEAVQRALVKAKIEYNSHFDANAEVPDDECWSEFERLSEYLTELERHFPKEHVK